MFVPISAGAFGSASRMIAMWAVTNKFQHKVDTAYLDIMKKHTIHVGTESDQCKDEYDNPETTACIAEFIHSKIGCSANILGRDETMIAARPLCNSSFEFSRFAAISAELQFADTSTITRMTGCPTSCEKDQFEIKMTDKTEVIYPTSSYYGHVSLWLYISMHETSYIQEEQYIIYHFNSFIADVGGYMGLLLGSSILSLYDEAERLINTFLCRFAKKP